ncbi:aminoglycoside phosphotransferase family protein [Lacticaseibacillus paracasei]|uniref:aminoglycoside phosphotransferase family protein n=1 Tax=Lacticaseibacillus paracasei TaxID=1597 RepID=UPI002FF84B90
MDLCKFGRRCELKIIDSVAKAYSLGSVRHLQALHNGKTSMAWQVEATTGRYIVKTIQSQKQAVFEFAVSNAVSQRSLELTPEILLSIACQPFVVIEGQTYQVQAFLSGTERPPSLRETLKSYRQMRQVLDQFDYSFSPPDSMPLAVLWRAHREALSEKKPVLFHQIAAMVPELKRIDQSRDAWIHGDLGKWNLLVTNSGQVVVIDFGEARLGPKLLDFAALFQGFMPKNKQDLMAYLNEFLALSGIQITDRHLFLMTVQLWLVKGLLIVINEQASLAGVFQNAIELVSSLV